MSGYYTTGLGLGSSASPLSVFLGWSFKRLKDLFLCPNLARPGRDLCLRRQTQAVFGACEGPLPTPASPRSAARKRRIGGSGHVR